MLEFTFGNGNDTIFDASQARKGAFLRFQRRAWCLLCRCTKKRRQIRYLQAAESFQRNAWFVSAMIPVAETGHARMEFGGRLKQAREQAHLSQEELGVKIGVAKGTIGRWERGMASPDAIEIVNIVSTTGADPIWLLGVSAIVGNIDASSRVADNFLMNEALIVAAVQAVEEWLAENRRTLAAELKGKVIATLIEEAMERSAEERHTAVKNSAARLLRLVA